MATAAVRRCITYGLGAPTDCCILTGRILHFLNSLSPFLQTQDTGHSKETLRCTADTLLRDCCVVQYRITTWQAAHCVSLSTVVGDHPGTAIGWCARVVPDRQQLPQSHVMLRLMKMRPVLSLISQECLAPFENAVEHLERLLVPDRALAHSLLTGV
ncbi:hypothetical protein HDV57DRAFT_72107 [Trichoderma longibrachiatum]|uniref:Uncharacterized protein n=1 Tax=Trichoderma longibrachiatum ATCC 18648 TaxID=983965 RepID=A0A2T4BUP9_TRILO|nr:hypothetical protein M440DRAFT_1070428 [Trichoderma longibrachiatum ATCC 18648]